MGEPNQRRLLIFGGEHYYPRGGWRDFLGTLDAPADATGDQLRALAFIFLRNRRNVPDWCYSSMPDWCQAIDAGTLQVVGSWYQIDSDQIIACPLSETGFD